MHMTEVRGVAMTATMTELFAELVRAEIELWNLLDAHLRSSTEVTLPQLQALTAIRAIEGAARVQDISAAMSITVGATSKVVDRLERDGLAVRSANPDDRRSSLVELTQHGSQALQAAEQSAADALQSSLGGAFDTQRVSALTHELSALRRQVAGA